MDHTLYSPTGQRLYLIPEERARFLKMVGAYDLQRRSFCMTLAYSGCRISEALALPAGRVDAVAKALVFQTLKQRSKTPVFRPVPVPELLLDDLAVLSELCPGDSSRLWPWGRTHGFQIIKEAMEEAGIVGAHAMPKGLRHGYAVHAVLSDIPLIFIQRWMGHSSLETTKLYLQVASDLAYGIAERMWAEPKKRCCCRR